MEEQFILRVPPSVAERIERLLEENASSSEDKSLDLSFSEDGRSGTFMIGNDKFPASLLDLPCVTESYKTYDDSVLIKAADIGQIIMVRERSDVAPDMVEYRHGLTPPMRDARRRRFRREPDLNPEVVQRVENDLWNIMRSGNILLDFYSHAYLHLFFQFQRVAWWLQYFVGNEIDISKLGSLSKLFIFSSKNVIAMLLFLACFKSYLGEHFYLNTLLSLVS